MLQKMRDGAQSTGAKIVAGILCFSLAAFGFGTYNLFIGAEPAAATINGEDISVQELERSINNERQRLRNQYGEQVTEAVLDQLVSADNVLARLVNQELIKQAAADMDLVGSPKKFHEAVRQDPTFWVDGVFDPDVYMQSIRNLGLSPTSYETRVMDFDVINQSIELYDKTAFVTPHEEQVAVELSVQTRSLAYLTISPDLFTDTVTADETEIENYYSLNLDSFVTEEEYSFEYVQYSVDSIVEAMPDQTLPAEAVEELVAAERNALSQNARRRAEHILLEVNESRTAEEAVDSLQELKRRVESGESFADLAREYSEDLGSAADGGDLNFLSRAAAAEFDATFDAALWALEEPGEVSEPVNTQFGFHLIRLAALEEVDLTISDERVDEIVADRLRSIAMDQFNADVDEIDKLAFEQSDSLQPIADAFDLEVKSVTGVTRWTGDEPFDNHSVRGAATDDDVVLNQFNSRPVIADDGIVVVARLQERKAPVQLELDAVREDVANAVLSEKRQQAVETETSRILEELETLEDYSAVAQEIDVEWQRVDDAHQSSSDMPSSVLEEAFKVIIPSDGSRVVTHTDLSGASKAIIVVSGATLGDYAATTEDQRQEITRGLSTDSGSSEFSGFLESLREDASIAIKLASTSAPP